MSVGGTLVIDRGQARYRGKRLDLRRHPAKLALIEFLLSRDDQTATMREILEDQHWSESRSWTPEQTEARFAAGRILVAQTRKALERVFGGGGWLDKTGDHRSPAYVLRRLPAALPASPSLGFKKASSASQ